MKVQVKVIGIYAVADEQGRLITEPGTLEIEKDEALGLATRKVVSIIGPIEKPEAESNLTRKPGDAENQEENLAPRRRDAKKNQKPETKGL